MKTINLDEIKEGNILSRSIVDSDTGAELLSAGTQLTLRHIRLLKNLNITNIEIQDETSEELSTKEKLDELYKEIDHIEKGLIFPPAERNAVNKNMEVNVLTGEGNIPIDIKHEKVMSDTKDVFKTIQEQGELDLERVKSNLVEALPDMVRNNDVLMRLNQLKKTDDYTFEHSMRVSILATMVGKWLGYSQEELLELSEAAMLYDIGKMNIPEEILKKPGPLSLEEMELIRKHPQMGYSILLKTEGSTQSMKYAALHHHERIDGSGYPLRLQGNQIHYFAKIIMVCDVFDALISDRPYKKKVSQTLALDYLIWNAGKTFDPEVVFVLVRGLSKFFVGKKCRLSDEREAKIVYVEDNYPTRPIVKIGEEFIDLSKEKNLDIDEIY